MSTRRALLQACGFLLAFCGLYVVAVLTPWGQALDAATLADFAWVPAEIRAVLADSRDVLPYGGVLVLAAVAAVTVMDGRARSACAVIEMVVLVLLVVVLLRETLWRPDFGAHAYRFNTYPSLNAAVLLSVCAGVVALLPAVRRPPGMLVATSVIATFGAIGSVATLAHRASDILGAALIVAAAFCLLHESGRSAPMSSAATAASAVAAMLVGAIALVLPAQRNAILLSAVIGLLAVGALRRAAAAADLSSAAPQL